MRHLIKLALMLLLPASLWATSQPVQGDCTVGGKVVVTSGISSTTKVQASYPSCLVTVSIHGGGVATIYSDANNTPLSNPFTADTNGHWKFYAAPAHYDVLLSGGTPPFPTPTTYADIAVYDPAVVAPVLCTVSFSATPTFNALSCSIFSMTLTGNVTASLVTNAVTGQELTFSLCQDSTGSRTFAWPVSFTRPPPIVLTASACGNFTFWYDGTNFRHLASADSASFNTLSVTTLNSANLSGAFNGSVGAATPSTGAFTSLSSTSGAINGTVGATTPNTGAFTSLNSTSGALNGSIGATTPSTGTFTVTDGTINAASFAGATADAKLRSALTSATTGQCVIRVPLFGAQTWAATLVINKSCTIIGPGRDNATYTLSNSINTDLIQITVSNVTLIGFKFDGNRTNQTAGYGINVSTGLSNIRIEDNTIQNVWNECITGSSLSNLYIRRNILTNCAQLGSTAANDAAINIHQSTTTTSSNQWYEENIIDSTTSKTGCIKINAANSGAVLTGVFARRNVCAVGDNTAANVTVGIEYFTSNGGLMRGGDISANWVFGPNTTNGILGVSIAGNGTGGASSFTTTENKIYRVSNACGEHIGNNLTITANTCDSSGPLTLTVDQASVSSIANTIALNTFRNCTDTANGCIAVTAATGVNIDGLAEKGNVINSTAGPCIRMNAAGGTIKHFVQEADTCVSSSTSATGHGYDYIGTVTDGIIAHNTCDMTGATGSLACFAIETSTATRLLFDGNTASHSPSYGFWLLQANDRLSFKNNESYQNSNSGMVFSAAPTNLTVQNFHAYGNGGAGFDCNNQAITGRFSGFYGEGNTAGNIVTCGSASMEGLTKTLASRNTALTATNLIPSASAGQWTVTLYAYDSLAGVACTGNTVVTWTIGYTDPTGTAQTQTAVETITTNGNATGGDKLTSTFTLSTNNLSAITYTTAYAVGAGCTTAPSYAAQLRAIHD